MQLQRLLERCTFPEPETQVTCAVSGGADSLALLFLAVEAGCLVTAVHVDHGIRTGSSAEADVVAHAAERFGAKFESISVEVAGTENLEARARAARFQALPDDALTGHTADDQAETVLINLMRGAGLDGLAGMSPKRHPILQLRRAETHQICADQNLQPVVDVSNTDPLFVRNRVRHELIPLMESIATRDVVPLLARQASLLRQEADFLNSSAEVINTANAKELAAAPEVLSRRAVRSWLRTMLDEECHPPDLAAVERVLAVARNEATATDVSHGWRVTRSSQRLTLKKD